MLHARDPPICSAHGGASPGRSWLRVTGRSGACGLAWSGRAPGPAARADQGACPGRPDGLGERADVVGTVVAFAVDEEGGGARDAAEVGGVHVGGDLGLSGLAAQVADESFGVKAELAGVANQVVASQSVLVAEQLVVHLPELALAGRGLGGLCRQLGVDRKS